MTNYLGVGNPQQFSHATVYRLDLSVQRSGKGDVVKGIDQFLEAALGAGNQFSQLIKLLIRGCGCALLKSADQVL